MEVTKKSLELAVENVMKPSQRPTQLLLLIALAVSTGPLHAGGPTAVDNDISGALEPLRAAAEAPGVVAMALKDGEVVAWGAAGVRAQGSDSPIMIDDPMHLGSCAKAMTSTLIAHLIEEDVLSWDTTIAEAMPEFAKKIDAGYHGVTIEALMKHQAGIAERRRPEIQELHGPLQTMKGSPQDVRLEILAQVMATPPSPSAAGSFDYSNFGYMAAGAMVETLTETSWEELMVEMLFKPLELKSAGVGSPSGIDVPVGHTLVDEKLVALPAGPDGIVPNALGPAGLVHSNLRDWGRFVDEHLAGDQGYDGFLMAESYQRLHQDHGGSGYAAGWGVGPQELGSGTARGLTHTGSDGSWFSFVLAYPEEDLTILIAANSAGPKVGGLIRPTQKLLLTAAGFED